MTTGDTVGAHARAGRQGAGRPAMTSTPSVPGAEHDQRSTSLAGPASTLGARLSVVVTGRPGQEYPDGHVEATAAHQGTNVTGATFVEMTGDWSRHR